MSLEIRQCDPGEFAFIVEQLDQEFVFGKQRSLSLCQRFPHTLAPANLGQIQVAVLDGAIHAACAVRLFDWVAEECTWRGGMVGMVWVDAGCRGSGIGSQLMAATRRLLDARGLDFGVIWTGRPAFYERAGWVLSDRGLFGEATVSPALTHSPAVTCRILAAVAAAWLEALHSRGTSGRVVRSALDYRAVPIPASQVWCFCGRDEDGTEGYALVGQDGNTGYFYEMVAPHALWAPMWAAIRGRFGRLLVNGQLGDPFSQWLEQEGAVTWRHQSKSMWLPRSDRLDPALLGDWHVPYFDWI